MDSQLELTGSDTFEFEHDGKAFACTVTVAGASMLRPERQSSAYWRVAVGGMRTKLCGARLDDTQRTIQARAVQWYEALKRGGPLGGVE